MHNNIKPILQHKIEYIILHVGTNDALNLPPNENLETWRKDYTDKRNIVMSWFQH